MNQLIPHPMIPIHLILGWPCLPICLFLSLTVASQAQETRAPKPRPHLTETQSTQSWSQPEPEDVGLPCERSLLPYQVALLDRVYWIMPGNETCDRKVAQDGTLDLGGEKILVAGLSREDLLALVKKKMPEATKITVEEFRPNRISVLGEVFHQLNSELADGPMRVMDAIAAANGFTPLANQRRVKLVRQNAGRVEVYELDLRQMMKGEGMKQNLLLRPGDVITVPRNFL